MITTNYLNEIEKMYRYKMYEEIEIIDKIKCKKTKIHLLLTFIQEYSGWLQHLKGVGIIWGAAGEKVGAAKESLIVKRHLEKLKNKLIELV